MIKSKTSKYTCGKRKPQGRPPREVSFFGTKLPIRKLCQMATKYAHPCKRWIKHSTGTAEIDYHSVKCNANYYARTYGWTESIACGMALAGTLAQRPQNKRYFLVTRMTQAQRAEVLEWLLGQPDTQPVEEVIAGLAEKIQSFV